MTSAGPTLPDPRERPAPPPPAVAEAEQQWIFTEEELLRSPSICDGMPPEEERQMRRKGFNFIQQVGVMLKLPQTTIGTAAVFFNRTLMRLSLVKKPSNPRPLHHYQIAGTALFLASKVEEDCRRMKELVIACVRIALKDPNLHVDEQTKDYWKWRDTILYSEDVLLEKLCFDVSIDSPYRVMYDMLRYYNVAHDKKLRNACWAFLSDSANTTLCLMFTARTIAAASVFCGARMLDVSFPDEEGRPWWEIQYVKLRDIRRVCNIMVDIYGEAPKDGEQSIYVGLRTPEDSDPLEEKTRLKIEQTPFSPADSPALMERSASEQSLKRKREPTHPSTNGISTEQAKDRSEQPENEPSAIATKRQKVHLGGGPNQDAAVAVLPSSKEENTQPMAQNQTGDEASAGSTQPPREAIPKHQGRTKERVSVTAGKPVDDGNTLNQNGHADDVSEEGELEG